MSEQTVKRYRMEIINLSDGQDVVIVPDNINGNYVLYTDYAALEQKLAVAEADLARLHKSLDYHYLGITEDKLKAAESTLSRMTAEREWIPVTERLPEVRTHCLIYRPKMMLKVATAFFEANYFYDLEGAPFGLLKSGAREQVTHWMPLPTPPQPNDPETVGDKHE